MGLGEWLCFPSNTAQKGHLVLSAHGPGPDLLRKQLQSRALKHKPILLNTTPLALWGVLVENINSKEH